MKKQNKRDVWFTVLVAALGYFVDIFDLQLFNVIGKKSLGTEGLNLSSEDVNYYYDFVLFNWQMGGMLVGGLIWGVMGDKLGRKSTLFGSILIYSLANIANGFVTNVEMYQLLRFIAGFGLAGELGAAVTLVAELMEKEKRGIGTVAIVVLGALGAVAAAFVSKMFSWQTAYFIGGGLGLALLLLRFGTFESGMFEKMKSNESSSTSSISSGNFLALFQSRERWVKYLWCIVLGLPIWYVLGVLIKFSPKIATATGVVGAVSVPDAVMYAYIGLSVGDLLCAWLSQDSEKPKKAVLIFISSSIGLSLVFLFGRGFSASFFLFLCFILGVGIGFWGLFVTIASEQFGTNLRATVTTTVPNFVRGAVIPITLGYKYLENTSGSVARRRLLG
ncbi:MAG: MFS transporter, partial [Saprospiraceae bacterium]|nr:MFS transporter [Saprospiraceae bacterium]